MLDYIILGGGLSGIISVSIIRNKYPEKKIGWIDNTNFTGGDLAKYPEVPANTPYPVLVKFIEKIYKNLNFPPRSSETCDLIENGIFKLKCLSKELEIISNHIRSIKNITMITDYIDSIEYKNNIWTLYSELNNYSSTRVVMCNGSIHRKLNYNIPEIPIEIALNPEKLRKLDIKNKKIAVFGNSHSGILILKNLYELSCKQITNIIKSNIKRPYMNDNNIEIYQESGIRGVGLEWANKFMVPENKTNIKVVKYDDFDHTSFDYVIYSIGLVRRNLSIKINEKPLIIDPAFNETGLLAKNLYGLGVAYPEYYILNGDTEYKVGIGGFFQRATKIL